MFSKLTSFTVYVWYTQTFELQWQHATLGILTGDPSLFLTYNTGKSSTHQIIFKL